MTLFNPTKKTCYYCGTINSCRELISYSHRGYADLDSRPPQSSRFLMNYLVEECEHCHFCHYDISKKMSGIDKTYIHSEEFTTLYDKLKVKKRDDDGGYNDEDRGNATKFLVAAFLNMKTHHYQEASYYFLHAIWALDDLGYEQEAALYRRKYLEVDALRKGAKDINRILIALDIKRRLGYFKEVIYEINNMNITKETDDFHKNILKFQKT